MEETADGFYHPIINIDLCVSCGICQQVCYTNQKDQNGLMDCLHSKRYWAYAKNGTILQNSASGGVASVLTSYAIQQGWHVVGTVYSAEENRAVSICTDNKANVFRMSGSKYIPAYTEEAVRASLKVPGNVLFIGTPCMVYSMRKLVEHIGVADRFYFVDFVCHGVPSLKIWRKHIEEMEKKYGSDIENVRFRSKHFGWQKNDGVYAKSNWKTNIFEQKIRLIYAAV